MESRVLSLQASGGNAANERTLSQEKQNQHRQNIEDGSRGQYIGQQVAVGINVAIAHGDGQRCCVLIKKNGRSKKISPDEIKGKDRRRRNNRSRQREKDLPEDAPIIAS